MSAVAFKDNNNNNNNKDKQLSLLHLSTVNKKKDGGGDQRIMDAADTLVSLAHSTTPTENKQIFEIIVSFFFIKRATFLSK